VNRDQRVFERGARAPHAALESADLDHAALQHLDRIVVLQPADGGFLFQQVTGEGQ
jgi:hypothetical protein